MAKIGFIGTGEIAEAMIRNLVGQQHSIVVSKRSEWRSAKLADEFDEVKVADNQQVLDCADYIILCLMADSAKSVLASLKFSSHHKVISAMVDVSLADLQGCCSPALDISITIPLPFIATGSCPLPVYPSCTSVQELFGNKSLILQAQSEKALNAHFAATALASVVFDQANTVSKWLASNTGDQALAEAYVVSMLGGYSASLVGDGAGRFEEQLHALSTEGGLNAGLRKHMAESGTLDQLKSGLDAFRARLGLDTDPQSSA